MEELLEMYKTTQETKVRNWFLAGSVPDFPENGGACIKFRNMQIAVFNFSRKSKWYACQNLCPHKMEMVLSRGLIGESESIPKVACPLHKKTFSLETGDNLNGDDMQIAIFPVRIQNQKVYIGFEN